MNHGDELWFLHERFCFTFPLCANHHWDFRSSLWEVAKRLIRLRIQCVGPPHWIDQAAWIRWLLAWCWLCQLKENRRSQSRTRKLCQPQKAKPVTTGCYKVIFKSDQGVSLVQSSAPNEVIQGCRWTSNIGEVQESYVEKRL
jgi:hypothetical protein